MNFFYTKNQGVDLQGFELIDYSYNPWLVGLSLLAAIAGSAVALYVVNSTHKFQNPQSKILLKAAGTVAFGLAVWSMHFIGMLAFSICTSVSYHLWITLASMIPALISAWIVLDFWNREDLRFSELLLAGLIAGAGIGVMHYSGLMAMHMSALLRFEPKHFFGSIIAAIFFATLALWLRGALRKQNKLTASSISFLSAVVMGVAITSMHYLAMTAARFIGTPESASPTPPSDYLLLLMFISIVIILVLSFVAFGVLFAKLKAISGTIKIRNSELETIIQHSAEAIVTVTADGSIQSVNKTFKNIFGHLNGDVVGRQLSTYLPQWAILLKQDKREAIYETLGRRKDGGEFPVRILLSRIRRGGITLYIGFLIDLSDIRRIQDKLIHEANHDTLTGLYNRRFFEKQLKLEIAASRRSKLPLSLLMLDIDHFKKVNDTYGHLVGDRTLAFLASELRKQSRKYDVVCRYGGEEFLMLLPQTTLANAQLVAERIRMQVSKLELISNQEKVHFSISLGLTCLNDENSDIETIINEADQAMYQAKTAGRNRVEVFPNSLACA